jgi:hypothetical protein
VQWVPGAEISQGLKMFIFFHAAVVKKGWCYTSIPTFGFMAGCLLSTGASVQSFTFGK